MKIIYTNLQEIDSGITRSVRQLRLDLGHSEDRHSTAAEGRLADEDENERQLLGSFRSSDRNVYQDTESKVHEDRLETHNLPALFDRRNQRLHQLMKLKSVGNVFIRKFVENQILTTSDINYDGRINLVI
jgi:hypothetical protein